MPDQIPSDSPSMDASPGRLPENRLVDGPDIESATTPINTIPAVRSRFVAKLVLTSFTSVAPPPQLTRFIGDRLGDWPLPPRPPSRPASRFSHEQCQSPLSLG